MYCKKPKANFFCHLNNLIFFLLAANDLNISEEDFLRGNHDMLLALEENGVGREERNEVIAILDSIKNDVVVPKA